MLSHYLFQQNIFDNIDDYKSNLDIIQRIFGLGTIRVESSDKTLKDFEIKNIKNSAEVKEELSELVEEQREKKRVSTREFVNDFDDDDEY